MRNVVVVKSLSKTLGVPGLRLGCVFTVDAEYGLRIRDELPMWNVNSLAEHFLEIILKYPQDLKDSISQTVVDRESFAAMLRQLDIVERVYESGANFLLLALSLATQPARQLADELLASDNLYVKDVSSKFADGRVYWRLAVRTREENHRLCAALRLRS
jgi:histidinol-phosphate/aromatic aminotransferase/cobyric acid decarboxylase-like protein